MNKMIRKLKLMENERTEIQRRIEDLVTNGLMYRELPLKSRKFKGSKFQNNLKSSEYNLKMHISSLDIITAKSNAERNLIYLGVFDLMLEDSSENYTDSVNSCKITKF